MSWWSRLTSFFTGRSGTAPGRFDSGSKFSLHGWVALAPFAWPSRDYLVYVPRGHSRWRRTPLLVLCHGCKQDARTIATSTRIAEKADRDGFVVLLPQQKPAANRWSCWNWFDRRTIAGKGEAAIVAAQIRAVRRTYRIDKARVVVAGMSAGGALAAIMGVRYPHLVRGVAIHSGLACGAPGLPTAALKVMANGPDEDVVAIGKEAREAAGARGVRVPVLAIHGSDDDVVAPRNAVAAVAQYLALNGWDVAPGRGATLPPATHEQRIELTPGRITTTREWRRDDRLVARLVEVGGLGHAWSGGDPAVPFTDAAPPVAGDLVAGWFGDALSRRR